MSTFAEVIYTVKNLPRAGNGDSRSNSYTDRQLAFIINYYRALLVKQYKDKGRYISPNYVQSLGKVEVQKASKHECCDLDNDIGDCIYRIVNPLPRPIDTNVLNLITYVGTVDGLKSWQRTTFNKVQFDKYAKYTANTVKWYELNNYIYIVANGIKNLKYINIQGIFEDPLAANNYKDCGCEGEDCFKGYNFDYPMNSSDIPTIVKMIASTEYSMSGLLPKDERNDSKDA
jgi:hypothetical protein